MNKHVRLNHHLSSVNQRLLSRLHPWLSTRRRQTSLRQSAAGEAPRGFPHASNRVLIGVIGIGDNIVAREMVLTEGEGGYEDGHGASDTAAESRSAARNSKVATGVFTQPSAGVLPRGFRGYPGTLLGRRIRSERDLQRWRFHRAFSQLRHTSGGELMGRTERRR